MPSRCAHPICSLLEGMHQQQCVGRTGPQGNRLANWQRMRHIPSNNTPRLLRQFAGQQLYLLTTPRLHWAIHQPNPPWHVYRKNFDKFKCSLQWSWQSTTHTIIPWPQSMRHQTLALGAHGEHTCEHSLRICSESMRLITYRNGLKANPNTLQCTISWAMPRQYYAHMRWYMWNYSATTYIIYYHISYYHISDVIYHISFMYIVNIWMRQIIVTRMP